MAMSPVIPFRRQSKRQCASLAFAALTVAVFGFAATWAFVTWQSGGDDLNRSVPSDRIEVIDGDTVSFNGAAYRLVGIDTPERGDKARCDDERRSAEAATKRLRALVASGDAHLTRVVCACRPGQEGHAKMQLRALVRLDVDRWTRRRQHFDKRGPRASLCLWYDELPATAAVVLWPLAAVATSLKLAQ
jgi:hypothetical protein